LTRILPEGYTIRGLTIFGNKMAVVRRPSEQRIEMYDATSLERLPRIAVRGLGADVYGLASCSSNNCLYVSDWHNSVVHRIRVTPGGASSTDVGKGITRWSVNRSPTGLSVTRNRNVLLTYWSSSVVDEFTTHGSCVRSINLQSDIVNPWQVIQVHSGDSRQSRFVVSHGDSDDRACRVCITNSDGRVLKSFGEQPGSGDEQLNVPISMAVVARDRRILVADQKNNRVLLLQPSLKGARDLLAAVDCEIHGPCALYLDDLRDRLYVGCWDGRLLIFDKVSNSS
jgi:hypothetical protein